MRIFLAIGGGQNPLVDKYFATMFKQDSLKEKPIALVIPSASYESKAFLNRFYKTYTSLKFKPKSILINNNEMTSLEIEKRINKASLIYIGGGNYKRLIDELEKNKIKNFLIDAYNRGVPIAGNSAGAMLFFKNSISDYMRTENPMADLVKVSGYGIIKYNVLVHSEEEDRIKAVEKENLTPILTIKSNEAILFVNEIPVKKVKFTDTEIIDLKNFD